MICDFRCHTKESRPLYSRLEVTTENAFNCHAALQCVKSQEHKCSDFTRFHFPSLGRVFKVWIQTSQAWVGVWGQLATASSIKWPVHISTTKPAALARTREDPRWGWDLVLRSGDGTEEKSPVQTFCLRMQCFQQGTRIFGQKNKNRTRQKHLLTRVFWQIKGK